MGTIFASRLAVQRQRDLVEAVLQDGVDAAVRGAANLQRALAGGQHALALVALAQVHQPQARAVAMLGMRTRAQDRLHQLGHRRSDGRAPRHQLGGRPFQMRAVRGGHVLTHGEEPLSTVATHMAGHPSATMDDLDDVGGGAHLDRLACQLVRHRVVAVVELDVIIDVHPRRFPRGELVAGGWQRLQRIAFELLEQVAA